MGEIFIDGRNPKQCLGLWEINRERAAWNNVEQLGLTDNEALAIIKALGYGFKGRLVCQKTTLRAIFEGRSNVKPAETPEILASCAQVMASVLERNLPKAEQKAFSNLLGADSDCT